MFSLAVITPSRSSRQATSLKILRFTRCRRRFGVLWLGLQPHTRFRRIVFRVFILLLLCLLSPPLAAKPIIADMSEYQIAINSDFTGKRLLLFGARNDSGDVIVVVRGPNRNVTLHKKKRVAGIWLNGAQVKFSNIPYFYAVTGTRPIAELAPSAIYSILGIGVEHLDFASATSQRNQSLVPEFRRAYFRHQEKEGLYQNFSRPLAFMGKTLFKTVIPFPDTLPRGNYTVDVYLINNGIIQSMQSLPIEVVKVGFDAFVYDMAHQHAWLYGIIAVLIAIGFGWLVSYIFTKVW